MALELAERSQKLVDRQIQKINEASSGEIVPEWMTKLDRLELGDEISVSTLLWDGDNRNVIEELLVENKLDDDERRVIMGTLAKLSRPMIDGQFPLDLHSIMVGTVRKLNDYQLERMGLNDADIFLIKKLFMQ